MTKVLQLHDGDLRCQALIDALEEVVLDRGRGMPIPSILGVLRLLEHQIISSEAN